MILLDLRLQYFHCLDHLRIPACQEVFWRIVHIHIRRHTIILQIVAFSAPQPVARCTDARTIHQPVRPGPDDRAVRCDSHYFAKTERTETVREDLGVRCRSFVLHHHHRPEITPLWTCHVDRITLPGALVLVLAEDLQQFLVDSSTGVEALVDDQPFFVLQLD